MNRFTNTLVNITYCSGIVILIVGLYDNKMRLMNVDDTQWIILSIVLGIVFPLILNALFFKKFSLHFWNKFK
jgi:FlaA1/EpsC-like NDP-sugar epimerase